MKQEATGGVQVEEGVLTEVVSITADSVDGEGESP